MICTKCGATISEKNRFCPECGKKNHDAKIELKPCFTNRDYLYDAKGAELARLQDQIKKLSAEELYDWLRAKHPPMECFVCHAEYDAVGAKHGRRQEPYHASRDFHPASIMQLYTRTDVFNLKVSARKKQLRRADLPGIGVRVFLTREECVKALGGNV